MRHFSIYALPLTSQKFLFISESLYVLKFMYLILFLIM